MRTSSPAGAERNTQKFTAYVLSDKEYTRKLREIGVDLLRASLALQDDKRAPALSRRLRDHADELLGLLVLGREVRR